MADWAVRNGPGLRIKQIIWYGRTFKFQDADPGWRTYCHRLVTPSQCANPTPGDVAVQQHMDHVHISVLN
jgi:hypothetical protein